MLGEQYECYRAFRLPWRGRPAQAPAIALDDAHSERAVYASWNGATDVHSWRLLAGAHERALRPRLTVRAAGFETSLPLDARTGPCLAVQALDAHGRTLGRSQAIVRA
jgi:hypothetical protein